MHEDDGVWLSTRESPGARAVLVVPKKPIESPEQLAAEDGPLLGHLWLTIAELARQLGIAQTGYRVVVNCGPQAGQSVDHLHFHILGGRALQWPPG